MKIERWDQFEVACGICYCWASSPGLSRPPKPLVPSPSRGREHRQTLGQLWQHQGGSNSRFANAAWLSYKLGRSEQSTSNICSRPQFVCRHKRQGLALHEHASRLRCCSPAVLHPSPVLCSPSSCLSIHSAVQQTGPITTWNSHLGQLVKF